MFLIGPTKIDDKISHLLYLQNGKRQQFELGQWLKQRYQLLFPNGYNSNIVRVFSSNVERAMMSAGVNLAGLFPPTKKQTWNEHLNWQPIPIKILKKANDTLLFQSRSCPLYDHLKTEFEKKHDIRQMMNKFQKTFAYVTKNFGVKVNSLNAARKIFDTLLVETLSNKTSVFYRN